MISHKEKQTVLELVQNLLTAQNNMDAEYVAGHDWETYKEIYNECLQSLEQYLEGLVA